MQYHRRMVGTLARTFLIRLVRSIQITQRAGFRITPTCLRNKAVTIHITSEIRGKAHQMLYQTTLKEHRKMWLFERIHPKICWQTSKAVNKCRTFKLTIHSITVASQLLHESVDLKCSRTLWYWKLIQKLKTSLPIHLTRPISRIALTRGLPLSTTTWKCRIARFLHKGLQKIQTRCSSHSWITSSSVEIEELRIVLETQQVSIRNNSPSTCPTTEVTSLRFNEIHHLMRIIQPL